MASSKLSTLPALRRQHLLAEFAGLKQACPEGIFVSLTPGDPSLWSGVIFVRDGPYAPAVLRFQISFPDAYPRLPPLVTFSTDMFHPLITPLTTYMYSTDVQDNGTVSATDEERLPPGGFSLRHGFPEWFGRRSRHAAGSGQPGAQQQPTQTPPRQPRASLSSDGTPPSKGSAVGESPGFAETKKREIPTFEVLRYIRSTFDDDDTLDSVPLEAAGNPGAWHAWRTHRQDSKKALPEAPPGGGADSAATTQSAAIPAAPTRKPGEWNWEGVWEERVKKGIAASLSEAVLFGGVGAADDVDTGYVERKSALEKEDTSFMADHLSFPGTRCYRYAKLPFPRAAQWHDTTEADSATPVHPGIIVTVVVLLIFLLVIIVVAIVRGFDLGPHHNSGLRGLFSRGRGTSRATLATLPSTSRVTVGDTLGSITTVQSHFIGQSQDHLPLPQAHVRHGSIPYPWGAEPTPPTDMEKGEHRGISGRENTPRASSQTLSGKTSSYRILRTQTPKLLTKLRSFSNGRASSSRATCRRYSLRSRQSSTSSSGSSLPSQPRSDQDGFSCFGSNSSDGTYDPDPIMPLGYDAVDVYKPRHPSHTLPPVHDLQQPAFEHSLLIPTIMAAIEISGQLYGYLYDVQLEILPPRGASGRNAAIIELINDQMPRTVVPGSSHLTLAHLQLGALPPPPRTARDAAQPADDLIADLEYQLGNVETELLAVRLSYCHSGFPQTRLQTTAVGTVRRHNVTSPWSPAPTPAPGCSPLFAIVASHWGPAQARELVGEISAARQNVTAMEGAKSNDTASKRWSFGSWW
ncbi:hypothetical protein JX265_003442 [Neoarthrinium moseri]|uniref:UBC core domain-containing protein n=1 Tax=Neoarthrinium moseri TaxID=1658444 RepID=A0A9P9WS75_9PEZI|nr:hypothetical protein JX265_003442 [Neoarthrinium moseri]